MHGFLTEGTYLRPLRDWLHPALRLGAGVVRSAIHARRGLEVEPECLTLACECNSMRGARTPLSADLLQLAIVSRQDGLTDWRYGMDPGRMRFVEVTASHFGLVFNPTAYAALARHLATASAAREPAAS